MEAEKLQKKLKLAARNRITKLVDSKKKKKNKEHHRTHKSVPVEIEENTNVVEDRSSEQKRRNKEKINGFKNTKIDQFKDEAEGERKKSKSLRNKKRKLDKINNADVIKVDELYNELNDGADELKGAEVAGEKSKLRKKKRQGEKIKKSDIDKVDKLYNEAEYNANEGRGDGMMEASQSKAQEWVEGYEQPKEPNNRRNFKIRKCKSKKAHEIKNKDAVLPKEDKKLLEKGGEAEQIEVYQISSGDEDCSKGMKKWISEYHQSRPGLEVLQQRIDDFITAHEAQEEQARKEREALAAEGGWTVVVHHKGRKKTTDSESGVTVGSVAPAAILDKMAKKKSKEIGLDFYRFQKKEAQQNEIMMLRSKFEQDRKRMQQMRAARKFRPY